MLLYTGRGDRQAAGGAAAVAAGRDREERVAVCTGKGVAVVSGGCGVTFLFFRVLIAESKYIEPLVVKMRGGQTAGYRERRG